MNLMMTATKAMDAYWPTMKDSDIGSAHDVFLFAAEKPMIESLLNYTNGNQTMAAKILGMNRGTFRSRLKRYKIGGLS